MNDQQKIKELYKKLPQKVREVIVSPELGVIIGDIAKNNGLDKNQADVLSKIVTYTLIGVETEDRLRANISKITGLDESKTGIIFDSIQAKIFNNLDSFHEEIVYNSEIEDMEEKSNSSPVIQNNPLLQSQPPKPDQPRTRIAPVGFEEAILNQARAMRPAEPVDGRIMNQELRIKQDVPHNLPTDNTPKIVHDYRSGNDPYREPLE